MFVGNVTLKGQRYHITVRSSEYWTVTRIYRTNGTLIFQRTRPVN